MPDVILVLNAGSSSLKFSAFRLGRGEMEQLARGQVEGIGSAPRFILHGESDDLIEKRVLSEAIDHEQSLGMVLERCRECLGDNRVVAVGHRVVHGGITFAFPVRIDEGVILKLEQLVPLAPLHQPHNLAAIRAIVRRSPNLPQVACFDTAFHRCQPDVAQWFGLPRRFMDDGVRRYGFHGLSYEFIATALAAIDPKAAAGRTVVAHLGNGASLCAMRGGRSVATTMSFTPADGLVMGTRAGSLDPGALLYVMSRYGMTASAVEHLINYESGLLGMSGISSDMRELLTSDHRHAVEAIDLFVYRISRELGSLAAALGGLDALVFTGGIGEHASTIRARVCRDAAWLGVDLDDRPNQSGGSRVSRAGSGPAVWVIPTDEERMIANHTRQVLGLDGVA